MLPIREAMSRRFVLFSTVVSNRFLKTPKASWFVIFENWFSTRNPILYWFSKLSRMEFRVETANSHHINNPSALPHNISNLLFMAKVLKIKVCSWFLHRWSWRKERKMDRGGDSAFERSCPCCYKHFWGGGSLSWHLLAGSLADGQIEGHWTV